MPKSVLIIGEDPAMIDFAAPGAPTGVTPESILAGLEGARDRLRSVGHAVEILLTRENAEEQVSDALRHARHDVIVIGAGLRTLPQMAAKFERIINVVHEQAPTTAIAFNTRPDDSDVAALRWLNA
ncbi:hypothetical protein IAG41_12225 [Sphingomonas sp. JC676]|uniref:hypothetical protein n=1 Tax=Sphingomonas sp. JC676 TaxID=2768065 RepID=UPI001657B30D|nr:hypothetical protein [Sphingomonas sp. JC676]MBC9033157.1 hypothetical protein [Sphingomonas sp. JC676]